MLDNAWFVWKHITKCIIFATLESLSRRCLRMLGLFGGILSSFRFVPKHFGARVCRKISPRARVPNCVRARVPKFPHSCAELCARACAEKFRREFSAEKNFGANSFYLREIAKQNSARIWARFRREFRREFRPTVLAHVLAHRARISAHHSSVSCQRACWRTPWRAFLMHLVCAHVGDCFVGERLGVLCHDGARCDVI